MSTEEVTVKAQCSGCNGQGVYHGKAEPRGTAVVCSRCDGAGYETISYIPFTGLMPRKGIKRVRHPIDLAPEGEYVAYEAFLKGKMPKKNTDVV